MEQFYCTANSCSQDLTSEGAGSAVWNCQNLACTCRPGTTFCGGNPAADLTSTINGLDGTLGIVCAVPNSSTNAANCDFKQSVLQTLFGASGLSLSACTFGECVRQSVIDTTGNSSSSSSQNVSSSRSLNGGVIAGLAVVGALVLIALLFLAVGIFKQRQARKPGPDAGGKTGGVSVHWDNVSYAIPHASGLFARFKTFGIFGRRRYNSNGVMSDYTILDSISGHVEPGQIMAILGPSGMCGHRSLSGHRYNLQQLHRCGKDDTCRDIGRQEQVRSNYRARYIPLVVQFAPSNRFRPPTRYPTTNSDRI